MPESRDYYRGAMRALLDIAESMNCPSDHELIDEQIGRYRAQLSTLPPAEPASDPSPCPDCAAAWGLVEECEKALKMYLFLEQTNGGRNPHKDGTNRFWALELGRNSIARISAARQKRGA